MKLRSVLLVICVMVIASCNKPNSSNIVLGKIIFSYDSINSKLVDQKFKYDSLLVNRIRKDSMTIIRYLGGEGYHFYVMLSLKNNSFYENRQIPQLVIKGETETYIVLIPTFMQKDTIFTYIPTDDFYAVFVNDLGFGKCSYQIKSNNEGFLTIKQSLIDTTYREIYCYDRHFNIYKYINTWKENKCVYIKN